MFRDEAALFTRLDQMPSLVHKLSASLCSAAMSVHRICSRGAIGSSTSRDSCGWKGPRRPRACFRVNPILLRLQILPQAAASGTDTDGSASSMSEDETVAAGAGGEAAHEPAGTLASGMLPARVPALARPPVRLTAQVGSSSAWVGDDDEPRLRMAGGRKPRSLLNRLFDGLFRKFRNPELIAPQGSVGPSTHAVCRS